MQSQNRSAIGFGFGSIRSTSIVCGTSVLPHGSNWCFFDVETPPGARIVVGAPRKPDRIRGRLLRRQAPESGTSQKRLPYSRSVGNFVPSVSSRCISVRLILGSDDSTGTTYS